MRPRKRARRITAHPTEAKRVSVLEIHRRIYLRLYDLESPRWTPRERAALIKALTIDIDILWMTGEVRLEKPTVEQEVAWGLHFFRETLFDRTPQLCELLEAALARHYPELPLRVRPPVRFYSWIGGDRDGNPYVTTPATRIALAENRGAAMLRLDQRLAGLAQTISISDREIEVPAGFRKAVAKARKDRRPWHEWPLPERGRALPSVSQCAAPQARRDGRSR